MNRAVVVAITSNIAKVYPGEAIVMLNGERRKAMADQIMAVSKMRLQQRLGKLSGSDMSSIEDAILLHLAIRRGS